MNPDPSKPAPLPPRWPATLLRWLVAPHLREEVLGDLHERYHRRTQRLGPAGARQRYWLEALSYLRPAFINRNSSEYPSRDAVPPFFVSPGMLRNYVKIAWRNLIRHKVFSAINIGGLSIGMVVSLLIGLWVLNEVSYDRFHANAPQLFRLTATVSGVDAAITSTRIAPALTAQLPAVNATVRVKDTQELISIGGQVFDEKRAFFVDPSFLTLFSFKLLQGNPQTALSQPTGVVITEETALKYFGTTNALGKIIRLLQSTQQGTTWLETTITGVLQNVPSNSHLQFDLLLPFSRYAATERYAKNDAWDAFSLFTYLRVNDDVVTPESRLRIEQQIDALYKHQQLPAEATFHLQPLTDIHLHTPVKMVQDVEGHGNNRYVQIFALVAIVILLIACINFMNLATARSAKRAKEVGLRKVIGATKGQLIRQFLGEAFIISFLASLIAALLAVSLLPAFNQLTGKQLTISLFTPTLLLGFAAITLVTSVMAGSYPALFMARFQPVHGLSGTSTTKQHAGFRNGLVIVQFAISIMLLVGTVIVYSQLRFIREYNSGFDKENLLYVAMPRLGDLYKNTQALKTTLHQYPETDDFSIVSDLPVNLQTGKSNFDWPGKAPNLQVIIPYAMADADFIKTFRINLLAGRNFRAESAADEDNYLVNETALKLMKMNLGTAIGMRLSFGEKTGQIIGVLKDFHFKPLQSGIEPLVLRYNKFGGYAVVRVQPRMVTRTLNRLKAVFADLYPAHPFAYGFVDEDVAKLYRSEQRMGDLFTAFAFFSALISCLGLFGLAMFTAEQRRKEIGVRKVLGASVASVVGLLSRDFLLLVLIATVIASPLAWYVMNRWLQGFAYKITIEWWMFAFAGTLALAIALLTVSFQSIKAALMNPVKSLRSE